MLPSIAKCITLLLSLSRPSYSPLPSLTSRVSMLKSSSMMTSLLKSSSHIHEIFHVYIETSTWESSESSSWKSTEPTTRKTTESSSLIKSLRLRIDFSSLIIYPSFFIIFEKLIGIDYLLKFLLCSWIFFVSIRMIFSRSSFECLSYLLFICISLYS